MKVFNASTSVSQYKGISGNLMKASTVRRRSKKQIEADKKREEEKKQEIEEKLSQFDAMQQQLTQQSQLLNDASRMHDQVNALVIDGILVADDNGNLDLNADDDNFERVVTDKIQTSKQKRALAQQQLNQQVDQLSQQSFHSVHEDEPLDEMS